MQEALGIIHRIHPRCSLLSFIGEQTCILTLFFFFHLRPHCSLTDFFPLSSFRAEAERHCEDGSIENRGKHHKQDVSPCFLPIHGFITTHQTIACMCVWLDSQVYKSVTEILNCQKTAAAAPQRQGSTQHVGLINLRHVNVSCVIKDGFNGILQQNGRYIYICLYIYISISSCSSVSVSALMLYTWHEVDWVLQ